MLAVGSRRIKLRVARTLSTLEIARWRKINSSDTARCRIYYSGDKNTRFIVENQDHALWKQIHNDWYLRRILLCFSFVQHA